MGAQTTTTKVPARDADGDIGRLPNDAGDRGVHLLGHVDPHEVHHREVHHEGGHEHVAAPRRCRTAASGHLSSSCQEHRQKERDEGEADDGTVVDEESSLAWPSGVGGCPSRSFQTSVCRA